MLIFNLLHRDMSFIPLITGEHQNDGEVNTITEMDHPVQSVLGGMRVQRMSLVQSLRQYAFVYRGEHTLVHSATGGLLKLNAFSSFDLQPSFMDSLTFLTRKRKPRRKLQLCTEAEVYPFPEPIPMRNRISREERRRHH